MKSSSDSPPASVVRLLDASLNRATEGARVVEDYARFVLGDAHLSRLAKQLRHGLAEAGAALPLADRLAARDSRGDVGATITTASERRREDAWDVCLASLERLQQATRSLEEYGKTLSPEAGAAFERLRYAAYTLASGLGATQRGRDRLTDARLYVLIDGHASMDAFTHRVNELCEANVDVIQLRDKSLDDRTLAERAKRLATLCRAAGVTSIVNDRPDVAAIAGADGVHVGQEELSVHDARSVVGLEALVGVSTHSLEQAHAAVLAGADYLGVGPTFPSRTKGFDSFPGTDLLREVTAEVKLPAFAIGGITAQNLPDVLATGATRVAVGSAITASHDPGLAATRLKEALLNPVGGGEPAGYDAASDAP